MGSSSVWRVCRVRDEKMENKCLLIEFYISRPLPFCCCFRGAIMMLRCLLCCLSLFAFLTSKVNWRIMRFDADCRSQLYPALHSRFSDFYLIFMSLFTFSGEARESSLKIYLFMMLFDAFLTDVLWAIKFFSSLLRVNSQNLARMRFCDEFTS